MSLTKNKQKKNQVVSGRVTQNLGRSYNILNTQSNYQGNND